jgi:hypothetical protein
MELINKPTMGGPELARRRGMSQEWLYKRVKKAEAAVRAIAARVPGAQFDNFPLPKLRTTRAGNGQLKGPREWNRAAAMKWLREEGLPQLGDEADQSVGIALDGPAERPDATTPLEPMPDVALVRFVPCFKEERVDADGIKWTADLPKAVREAVKWIVAQGEPVRLEAKCEHLECRPKVVMPRKDGGMKVWPEPYDRKLAELDGELFRSIQEK